MGIFGPSFLFQIRGVQDLTLPHVPRTIVHMVFASNIHHSSCVGRMCVHIYIYICIVRVCVQGVCVCVTQFLVVCLPVRGLTKHPCWELLVHGALLMMVLILSQVSGFQALAAFTAAARGAPAVCFELLPPNPLITRNLFLGCLTEAYLGTLQAEGVVG